MRYRHGVYIDLRGYPDWQPYAAAMAVVPRPTGLTAGETRLVTVLAANQLVAEAGAVTVPNGAPAGWVWAHLGRSETMALVPADLHGAFRHRGAISDLTPTDPAGTWDRPNQPVPWQPAGRVTTDAIEKFENWLGYRLPSGYRDFLAATNGGRPATAAIVPGGSFLLDQPLFGLAAEDRMQDLAYANLWLRDRLTAGFLAIGYVQGGLLVLQVRGERAGSVWHWDDDDRRDDERYGSDVICRDLLRPCGPDVETLRAGLSAVPEALAERVREARTAARLVRPDGMGAALPRSRQPAWISAPPNAAAPD